MPDFTELKQRHAAVWSNGPFEEIAEGLRDMHEALVHALGPRPGERWLDLGCGSGNMAELAAGAGVTVLGIDLSPRLIDVARARAEAGDYAIEYAVGDAENLAGIDDASLDVVASSVGMVFAPDHAAVAREVSRVLRPGGRLAFSAWTPEGRVGEMFRLGAQYQPAPPEGAGSPLQWGAEAHVHELLDDTFDIRITRRISRAEAASADDAWALFSSSFGPTKTLLEILEPDRRAAYEREMRQFFAGAVQPDGRVVDDREYLLVSGVRR